MLKIYIRIVPHLVLITLVTLPNARGEKHEEKTRPSEIIETVKLKIGETKDITTGTNTLRITCGETSSISEARKAYNDLPVCSIECSGFFTSSFYRFFKDGKKFIQVSDFDSAKKQLTRMVEAKMCRFKDEDLKKLYWIGTKSRTEKYSEIELGIPQ